MRAYQLNSKLAHTERTMKYPKEEFLEKRTRPAFEKLLVGPIMVFGEMVTGGHYMEVLRLGKQLSVGQQYIPSFYEIHRANVAESGFLGAFYRGFIPWGLFQTAKGIPVLFVQNESMYQLRKRGGWSKESAEKASGFIGGASQALFVTPFQKIKVSVVDCGQMNSMRPIHAIAEVVRRYGILSLYDGVVPMAMRRSLDWGVRFYVSNGLKNEILRRKRERGEEEKIEVHSLVACGFIGGAVSSTTYPFDAIVTNCQRPVAPGTPRDVISVVTRMYQENGISAFTRGWIMKVGENSYHMAWMYGVGTVVYDQFRKLLGAQ